MNIVFEVQYFSVSALMFFYMYTSGGTTLKGLRDFISRLSLIMSNLGITVSRKVNEVRERLIMMKIIVMKVLQF
jgi:hypothetical protein